MIEFDKKEYFEIEICVILIGKRQGRIEYLLDDAVASKCKDAIHADIRHDIEYQYFKRGGFVLFEPVPQNG